MIMKLLEDIKPIKIESPYLYYNLPVPRVTKLLSFIHEDYLMIWSNSIGLYRHEKYKDNIQKAAMIGTYTHEGIERFIKEKVYNQEIVTLNDKEQKMIDNGIQSFILWYDNISKDNKIEILEIEKPLICPYFGGTLDMLCKINDVIYLVDFKTSNHIGYKYFMQLAAYRYMLKTIMNIDIGGCIILQVDKKKIHYEEYTLDLLHDEFHREFLNQCENTFMSIVYSWNNVERTKQMYNDYLERRK